MSVVDDVAARRDERRALVDRLSVASAADVLACGQLWSQRQDELWRLRAPVLALLATVALQMGGPPLP